MSPQFKLTRQQRDEIAYVLACRKGWRYPVPLKVLAHRYGVCVPTIDKYVRRLKNERS